jgi:retron-type reverse transcriptase
MAIKKYVLTIEFNDNGDNCEYIQEEIIDDTPEDKRTIYEADIDDYFSTADIAYLLSNKIAKA